MYDRGLPNPHPIPRPKSRAIYRIQTLVGITGARMARYRTGWRDAILACPAIIWRPQILGILLFEVRFRLGVPLRESDAGDQAMLFGFSIGINVSVSQRNNVCPSYSPLKTTNAVFLGTPPPVGYGFNEYAVAGAYATPIVTSFPLPFRYSTDSAEHRSLSSSASCSDATSTTG